MPAASIPTSEEFPWQSSSRPDTRRRRSLQGQARELALRAALLPGPVRPSFSNNDFFFSPADGVDLYQEEVEPSDSIVDIKGRPYSLREALRDSSYDRRSLVIGIFMTFFDVHVNRVPYSGRLSYRQVEPIDTLNHPMLEVEESILDDLRVTTSGAGFYPCSPVTTASPPTRARR